MAQSSKHWWSFLTTDIKLKSKRKEAEAEDAPAPEDTEPVQEVSQQVATEEVTAQASPKKARKEKKQKEDKGDKARRQKGRNSTLQLWGREFSVVKGGLDQTEVVRFVNSLLTRHKTQLSEQSQKEPMPRLLAKQIIAEAERDAATLRNKARQEADVELASHIAEARRKARIILSETKEQARENAEQESRRILDTANQKAELLETQALRMAHLFMLRVRDEIQTRIATETKEIYHRLLAPVQELLSTAESVENEWATKKLEPSWGKPSELKDYQFTLLESLTSGEMDLGSLLDEERLRQPPTQVASDEGPTLVYQEESAEEAAQHAEDQLNIPLEELSEIPVDQEEVAEEPGLEEIPIPESLEEEIREAASTVVEDVVVPQDIGTEEESLELQTEEEPALETVAVEEELVLPQDEGAEKDKDMEPPPTSPVYGEGRLYSGEVDMVVSPPVTAAQVTALYGHLQSLPDVKVLRTSGSWDRGTVVTVALERPLPLASMLSEFTSLEVTANPPGSGALKGLGERGRASERIMITINSEGGSPRPEEGQ